MRAVGFWTMLVGGAAAVAYAGGVGSRTEAAGGWIDRYGLDGAPTWEVTLPDELMEVSGLAFTADGRLFAHGDEDATVWELDPRSGEVRKSFALASDGDEPAQDDDGKKEKKGKKRPSARPGVMAGDFEDIEIVGDQFFLVTSDGVLHEFAEGEDGGRVPSTARSTGLGESCEVEGLTYDASARALLLLCKENLPKKSAPDRVIVRAWSLDDGRLEPEPRIAVDYAALAEGTGEEAFKGSAMALMPNERSLVLVAGPQQAFAEIAADGRVVAAGALDREVHRQPEGVAFAPDGTLLIANEGAGGQPSLSGYAPRSPS